MSRNFFVQIDILLSDRGEVKFSRLNTKYRERSCHGISVIEDAGKGAVPKVGQNV